MTTVVIAAIWAVTAIGTLVLSLLAINETRGAPGMIEFVRAVFVGSLIDCGLMLAVLLVFLPNLIADPRPLTTTGLILTFAFFSRTLPVLVLEMRLLQRTGWFEEYFMAQVDSSGTGLPRVNSGGPVNMQPGEQVVVRVKRLSLSKTTWVGIITVAVAALEIAGQLPELAPYNREMLAVVGILMVVLRVVTNQPVALK